MSTFGTMVAEIREEIRRSGMDNAIKRAIGAAVVYHRDKRFLWNELSFTLATVANQAAYDSTDDANIGRLAKIDTAKIASPATVLTPRTLAYIRGKLTQTSGTPADIAFFQEEITLDPAPSSVLSINIDGLLELKDTNMVTTPVNLQVINRANILSIPDAYTTAWFVEGFEIIKSWAKGYLYQNNLRNTEQAATDFTAADGFKTDQEGQLAKLGGSGFAVPTRF